MNKKFIRVLGFGVGLFLAGSLSVNAQKVSFNGERLSLKQAFEKIESVSKYKIAYNTSQLDVNKQVVLNQKNQDVLQILSDLLKGTNCVYQVNDNYIVITLKDDEKVKKIKGTIKDSAGEPIIGANVILKGDATVGSITDIDGNFDLSVPSNATLQVSYIGYNTQDVPIGNKSFLNITLKEDTETLDEVVVVGYGSQKKVNVIGSIASVDSKALESRAVPDVSNMLTGQMSGVTITQESGNPGQDAGTIRIRGVGSFGATPSPLVLVDGLPGSLSDLTPADIDNISVLKDASSAAIYGSRAANGVVVITTVAPKPGEIRVSYNFTGTLELPDLRDYNLANASQKLEIERLAGLFEKGNNNNIDTSQGMNAYYKKYAYIQKGVDTDWMSLPLQNAFDHKHSVYIEGGTPNLRYGVDASYNGVNGVMKGSGRDRYSIGFSLDYRVKQLQVKNTVTFGHTKSKESPYGSFSDYTRMQPYETPYEDDGTLKQRMLYSISSSSRTSNNPLYEATLGNYEWSAYDELVNNLSLNWYLNDYLTVKGQFSVTKKYASSEKFYDPLSSKVSVYGESDDAYLAGDLYTEKGGNFDWNTNAFLYYTRSFHSKHNINVSVGWEAASSNTDNTKAHYRGFPSGEFNSLNYATEIYKKPTRTENTTRRISTLATANYTWNDIYLADASVRFDGSSEFGANQKWAPFFSGGLGVNVHNYAFLKGNKDINKLKVRASYGRTGKVNFPAYAATTMYQSLFDEWYITGYGAVLKALGNKDLTWEKTDKYNIGIETLFFNQRLTVEAEYYYEKTIDLINDFGLSSTSGFSSYKNNMGEILNKGFELQLRADVFRDRNWTVALWGNMAHNTNEILKISDSQKKYNERVAAFYQKEIDKQLTTNSSLSDANYSVPIPQYAEGQSLTSIWAVRSLGIDPTTGKEIFLNRDGSVTDKWDASQEVAVGNTEPKFNGSFGLNVTYKNWSLFASFLYEWGGQEYNQTLVDNVENANIKTGNVDLRVLTDRWKKPGDIAQFKDIKDSNLTTLPTSRFVQDKALLHLNSLTISYDFDREWIKKHLRMNMLRLEANTSELINWNSIRQERGLSYPRSWKMSFSLKAQF